MTSLAGFFLLTFGVTWSCWAAASQLHGFVQQPLFLVGTFAPALVALAITWRTEGSVRGLIDRILRWEVSWKWYAFAVLYMIVIKLGAAVAVRVLSGSWPEVHLEVLAAIIFPILISTPVQAGEEIGWRGFALPRMAARLGYGWSSILLGVIWAVWHLPLFLIPGVDNYGKSFPAFFLGCTALSVGLAWVFANTRGSLLLTMLMHSAVNQTIDLVPERAVSGNPLALRPSLLYWCILALLWISAGYFLARMPKFVKNS